MPRKKTEKKTDSETYQTMILNDYMHNIYDMLRLEYPDKRKRKRSDSVLWLKPYT